MLRNFESKCNWFGSRFIGELIRQLDGKIPIFETARKIMYTKFNAKDQEYVFLRMRFHFLTKSNSSIELFNFSNEETFQNQVQLLQKSLLPKASITENKLCYLPCDTMTWHKDLWKLVCIPLDICYQFLHQQDIVLIIDIDKKVGSEEISDTKPVGAMRIVFPSEVKEKDSYFDFDFSKAILHFVRPQKHSIEYMTVAGIKICDMRIVPNKYKVLSDYIEKNSTDSLRANEQIQFAKDIAIKLAKGEIKYTEDPFLASLRAIMGSELIPANKIFSDNSRYTKRMTFKNIVWSKEYH